MRKATTETAPEGHIGNLTALVSFILAEFAHRLFCTAIEPRLSGPLSDTPVADECLVDLTPPPLPREDVAMTVQRERGAGRPTKRERRDLERLRDRWPSPQSPVSSVAMVPRGASC